MSIFRLTTIEEFEQATERLLETGQKVGADSWQARVKNQTPHCKFGEEGIHMPYLQFMCHAVLPKRHREVSAAMMPTVLQDEIFCVLQPEAQQLIQITEEKSAIPFTQLPRMAITR